MTIQTSFLYPLARDGDGESGSDSSHVCLYSFPLEMAREHSVVYVQESLLEVRREHNVLANLCVDQCFSVCILKWTTRNMYCPE